MAVLAADLASVHAVAMATRELWSATHLATGERKLDVHPPPTKLASLIYVGLSAALFLGGLGLLARGSCFFGLAMAAVGAWMLFSVYRLYTRG